MAFPAKSWIGYLLSNAPGSENIPLNRFIIPGTHDSGTGSIGDYSTTFSPTGEVSRDLVDLLSPFITGGLSVEDFAKTQYNEIYRQLNDGARYIDLRVHFDGNTAYLSHDFLVIKDTVDRNLKQIKRFLDENNKEIVILKLSHFKGETVENHESLVNNIRTTFGDLLYDSGDVSVKLGDLVSSGKRLITIYASEVSKTVPYLLSSSVVSQSNWHTPENDDCTGAQDVLAQSLDVLKRYYLCNTMTKKNGIKIIQAHYQADIKFYETLINSGSSLLNYVDKDAGLTYPGEPDKGVVTQHFNQWIFEDKRNIEAKGFVNIIEYDAYRAQFTDFFVILNYMETKLYNFSSENMSSFERSAATLRESSKNGNDDSTVVIIIIFISLAVTAIALFSYIRRRYVKS